MIKYLQCWYITYNCWWPYGICLRWNHVLYWQYVYLDIL